MSSRLEKLSAIAEQLKIITNTKSSAEATSAAVKVLDAIMEQQAAQLHGDLRHFLARRSYHKALIWIEESGPIPRGLCGRGE